MFVCNMQTCVCLLSLYVLSVVIYVGKKLQRAKTPTLNKTVYALCFTVDFKGYYHWYNVLFDSWLHYPFILLLTYRGVCGHFLYKNIYRPYRLNGPVFLNLSYMWLVHKFLIYIRVGVNFNVMTRQGIIVIIPSYFQLYLIPCSETLCFLCFIKFTIQQQN